MPTDACEREKTFLHGAYVCLWVLLVVYEQSARRLGCGAVCKAGV